MFKILLIEDDISLYHEIKERLTGWSYHVSGIKDFGNVLQEFSTFKPDLVIIDIQLPKFDGFHWCRMIRSHSNIPIVFLSSRDHPMDMVMAMPLGPMILFKSLFISMFSSQRYKRFFDVSIITAQNQFS